MTTAVLVHGGWHSASCWDLVRAELDADGIRSVAPQLPMTSTLDVDAAVVRETLDSLDDDAVVVAHSWEAARSRWARRARHESGT